MFLAIDGNDRERMIVGVARGNSFQRVILPRASLDATLPLLAKFFVRQKIAFSTISGLAVVPGPGHFSSIREMVVLANVFAWQTQVPLFTALTVSYDAVKKRKRVRQIKPFYGAEPNISKPKSKKIKL